MSQVMAGRSKNDPSDNLKMKPPKGILKSSSSFEAPDAPSGSRRVSKASKETTFDEMNILETLHPPGKDYGHMKIDEPKTPFERDVPDSFAVDPGELAKKIEEESQKPMRSHSSMSEESDDEDLTPEEREKKRQFEMKRKAHYNEFLMAKKKLQELKDEEDEEDE